QWSGTSSRTIDTPASAGRCCDAELCAYRPRRSPIAARSRSSAICRGRSIFQGMSCRYGESLPRRSFDMSTSAVDFKEFHDNPGDAIAGTRFGLSAGMLPNSARQRDRRQAFADLLAALTRGLDRRNDISLLRGAFEEMIRRVVQVRTIQLREAGSRWTSRPAAAGVESFAIEVPGADPLNAGVLEATFDPSS